MQAGQVIRAVEPHRGVRWPGAAVTAGAHATEGATLARRSRTAAP